MHCIRIPSYLLVSVSDVVEKVEGSHLPEPLAHTLSLSTALRSGTFRAGRALRPVREPHLLMVSPFCRLHELTAEADPLPFGALPPLASFLGACLSQIPPTSALDAQTLMLLPALPLRPLLGSYLSLLDAVLGELG